MRSFKPFLTSVFFLAASAILSDARGQSQTGTEPPLAFEVASIKPAEPGARGRLMQAMPGGTTYIVKNWHVRFMMQRVYHVISGQIVGGPGWMNTDCYNIQAKAAQPSSKAQLERMFQGLLADRFRLQFHRETRELPVYALVIDKKGSKLKLNETVDEFGGRIGPNIFSPSTGGLPGMTGVGVPISELCWNLSQILARPVTDETGLTGFYDFKLEYATAGQGPQVLTDDGEPPPALEGPTIFSALPEQLGLRLRSQKGPVEVLVIDKIEKPSVN